MTARDRCVPEGLQVSPQGRYRWFLRYLSPMARLLVGTMVDRPMFPYTGALSKSNTSCPPSAATGAADGGPGPIYAAPVRLAPLP